MGIMTEEYEPSLTVNTFHGSPRFGHASTFANLFSSDTAAQADYVQGIVVFGILLVILLTVWLLSLLLLKVTLGRDRIGCAAGGGPILVNDIKKHQPHLKPMLQSMVKRSWRIQSCFIVAALLLPVATALFLFKGLNIMEDALENIQNTNEDIERVAHRSIGIVDSLIQERDQLVEMQTEDLFDIEKHCPRLFLITSEANENETMLFQNLTISGSHVSSQLLTATLKDMDRLVEDTVVYARTGLLSVSTTTEQVDSWLDYFFENDWIPKLYLVALNVVNLFLIGGVILSRNNIIHHPYKCMLVWFLIPIFVGLLMMATVGASGLGMAASVNADFCAGGDTVSGPAGTLQDIILSHDVTKEDLSYRSFDYYMNACTTENPLNFVVEYMPLLRDTIRQGNDFLKLVGDISDENTAGALDGMNRECGADASPLVSGVQRLVESLDTVHANIESALDISDCATISPIVRGIFHGSSCKEAVDGLAWMFGTTLGIAMLGLVLITLRAGLYNATIRKARRSKPEATEKEFREYKRYMTQFYDDAPMWKLEPDEIKDKKTKTRRSRGRRRRGGMGLEMAPSFETGITATSTFDNNDDDYDKYGNDDSSHESHFADDDLDQDGNNYDDDSSDDDDDSDDVDGLELEFKTPSKHCKRHGENTTTFVDQVRTAEKLRGMMHVLDEEMEPLSPPSQHHRQEHVSSEHHERQQQQVSPLAEPDDQQRPRAPQKLFRNLQRTTQRKTLL